MPTRHSQTRLPSPRNGSFSILLSKSMFPKIPPNSLEKFSVNFDSLRASPELFIYSFNHPTLKRYWAFYDCTTHIPHRGRARKTGVGLGMGGLWESVLRSAERSRRASPAGVSHFLSCLDTSGSGALGGLALRLVLASLNPFSVFASNNLFDNPDSLEPSAGGICRTGPSAMIRSVPGTSRGSLLAKPHMRRRFPGANGKLGKPQTPPF